MKNNLGFNLNELETELVLARYDKDQDFKIKKEEFISEVALVNPPVEEQQDDNDQQNNDDYQDDFEQQ